MICILSCTATCGSWSWSWSWNFGLDYKTGKLA